MSDFHERLDRASRGASPRPDALDRLRDRLHRHERRQRVTATVVGLTITVMLVGGGFALLNGRDDVRPGGTGTQPMYLGLWPERTLAEAQQVQSAVDSGDQTESWRTDPEEVAKRFVVDVMGWDKKSLSATLEGNSLGRDRLPIHVQGPPPSCPVPGCPWWMDRSQWVTVERVVTGGDVWAVVFTQTMPPMRSQYAIGQDVDTNAPLKGWIDSGNGEPIILGGEGGSPCSGGEVIEVFGPDNHITANYTPMKAQVSSFRSPDCGQTGEGYIALAVSDDGVPLVDPLTPWGSQSGPRPIISALTMVPVRFVESPPSPELSPVGAGEATPVLERDFATVSAALRRDNIWVAPYSSSYGTPTVSESEAIAKTYPDGAKDVTAMLAVASGQTSVWPDGRRVVWLVMSPPGWAKVLGCAVTIPPTVCHDQYQFIVEIVDAETGRVIMGTNVVAEGNPTPPPSPAVPDDTHLSAYLVQSGLLDRVMTMAAANEVPQPESIQAVVAAPNEVTALLNEVPAAHGPPASDVVFVQVAGDFVCHTCKQLSDTPITGSAMYVEIKVGSGGITGWGILKEPLDLAKLGTPVDIPVPG